MGSVLKQTVMEWLKTDFFKESINQNKTNIQDFSTYFYGHKLDFSFLMVHKNLNWII